MKASTLPGRTRFITTLSTLLPRWDTTWLLHMPTASPIVDSRTLRLLYLLCTLTRSRLLSMSPHIGSELRTRQLDDSPSGHLISPSSRSHSLSHMVGCSRKICCVYCQCCCWNHPPLSGLSLTDTHRLFVIINLPPSSLFGPPRPYPDLQYIFVDFSTRIRVRQPLCFYFPLSIRSSDSLLYLRVNLFYALLALQIRTRLSLLPKLTTICYDATLPLTFCGSKRLSFAAFPLQASLVHLRYFMAPIHYIRFDGFNPQFYVFYRNALTPPFFLIQFLLCWVVSPSVEFPC